MGHDTASREQGLTTACTCAAWLAGESRYKCCIVAGGDLWVAIQHATQSTAWLMSRNIVLYRDKGGLRHCARARSDTAGHGHDTAGHRRYTAGEGATIRPSPRHDTASCKRLRYGARIVGAQLGPWVCILCTQPSFDSGHCLNYCS